MVACAVAGVWTLYNRRAWSALAGAVVGVLVILAAPGNAIRAAQLPPRLPIVEAIVGSYTGALVQVIYSIAFAPGAVLLPIVAGWLVGKGKRLRKRWLLAAWVFVAVVNLMALSLFPTVWGQTLTERGYTTAQSLWVVMLMAWGYIAGCKSDTIEYTK